MKKILRTWLQSFPHLDVDVISNEDIDNDLFYMVKAKHFIRGQWGFSDLVVALREIC